tara:strand:+ start:2527 stop:3261 length:735 start_codon:yes stop_codon:yes gene_type:complete
MINQDKWIGSIPKSNHRHHEAEINQLDYNRWVNTIPKKNGYNSIKKYSLTATFFIVSLLLVSALKNETRKLQKEINNLQTSINIFKHNLNQATLDNEVITSPENISRLAKEHLNIDLVSYKRSQIKSLNNNDDNETLTNINKIAKKKNNTKKINNLSTNIKTHVAERIKEKKQEIRKLQELYSNPSNIPTEVKTQIARQIKEKKVELKNIYESPRDVITMQSIQRWTVVQIVKVFLGIPIVPGR